MRLGYGLMVVLIVRLRFGHTTNTTDCYHDVSCLRCVPSGCAKCADLIVHPSRECVHRCPSGYTPRWSTLANFMGMMCTRSGNGLLLPLQHSDASAVAAGIVTGMIVGAVIVGVSVFYVRRKRGQMLDVSRQQAETTETGSDMEDSPEKREFAKQLDLLRPYAAAFLEMLNDTRRQLRVVYREGDNTAASAYRPVVRDLAKILLLLNRPADSLPLPDDWDHLFRWAVKTLKRYRRMSGDSDTQVTQLIHFLQPPLEQPRPLYSATSMSTFKPDHSLRGSSQSLQKKGVRDATLQPQWQFDYPIITLSQFIPAQWRTSKELLSNSYVLDDDDFTQLGCRPQDEITTEL